MPINPWVLRLTWATIESVSYNVELATLTDTALVKLIMQQVSKKLLLSGEEICLLYDYISSKTTLIREIAECHQHQRENSLQLDVFPATEYS